MPDFEELAGSRSDERPPLRELELQLLHVAPHFYKQLLHRCPSLSKMELRVCALTRLGMDTKEVSEYLAISAGSILNHRSNIRTKLGLERQEDLYVWLCTL